AGLESIEARLVVYKQNESILEETIKLLNFKVQARDTALVTLRQKLNQAKQEMDDLKLKLDKFQTSSKNLTELLASQTNDKPGLGYFSSKSDSKSLSLSSLSNRLQPSGGYHAVPPPIIGTFMPPKPDLVFHTAPIAIETDHSTFTVQLSPSKYAQDLSHTTRPLAPIIEDWVSDFKDESETNDPQSVLSFVQSSEQVKTPRHSVQPVKEPILDATLKPTSPKSNRSGKRKNRKTCFLCRSVDHLIKDLLTQSKPVSITAVRPASATVPKIMVTRPRHAHSINTKSRSPIRRHITRSPSPKTSNLPPRVTAAQAPVGNPQYALKDKGVIDSGYSWHMTVNMSYLSDFEEGNSGYVAFGGNPKGGKISSKGKIKTGKLDFEDVYFVKELKFNIFSVSQMCDKKNKVLFTDTECLVLTSDFKLPDESQATIDESNLWHRRLGHINFKTINKLVKGNRDLSAEFEDHFDNSSNDEDATFDGKEHDVDTKKPESAVNVSPSSSAQSGKQDDMTKKKAKGKSPVEFFTGNRDLSAEFEDHFDNNSNGINAAGSIVPTIGQNSSNNTNPFSAAGPLNTTASPTHRKSSFKDAFQLPDSPDMPEMEEITYADHENVGAEADFNNLETSITVSPIPTTRNHKDHHVSQIIGDLSSTTQTRSMSRVIKDQDVKSAFLYRTIEEKVYVCQPPGFEDPDHPDKLYKVVKALYGLHQAPRACQDKYVAEILKKFWFTEGKSASTPIDTEKLLLKDPDGEDVDVQIYRSMIGSLMYLTSSRPDIMFADSPFDLVAYSDSDYAGVSLDRKSTTEGCQFLGCRLISWQCKKQTVVATSSTEAEYVAATSCYAQVLWIQNQLLDYGSGILLSSSSLMTSLGDDVQDQSIPSPTPPTPPPQQPQDLPSTSQRFESSDDIDMEDASNQGRMIADLDRDEGIALMDDEGAEKKVEDAQVAGDEQVKGMQAEIYQIDMDHASKVLSMQEDEPEVQKVVEVVTTAKLIIDFVDAVSESVSAASETTAAVPAATITAAPVRVSTASTKKRKGMVIRDPKEELTAKTLAETKSKDKGKGIMVEEPKPMKKKQQVELDEEYARKLHEELNKDIGWDVAIDHVKQKAKEDPYAQRYEVMKKRPEIEAQAQRNMIMYLKNFAGFRLDYFKGMYYDDIHIIFEAKFNTNIKFLLKSKEEIEEEENRALESINKTPAQKAAKRRRMNEEVKDVEELKQHLEIVPDEDDDVYTEATLLARKVPVVDYQIIQLNNKPRYKIIRADGTHQLYVSFITLLKNFDREDLESLWSTVKERFSTSKPNNYSDNYLLTTLRAMFGRPYGQDQVWKSQRSVHGQAKVKSWKLLESCGVHIISFTTTQLILLVERRYPLLRFTLDQMLNAVRLQVEKQSEMSLELLSIEIVVYADSDHAGDYVDQKSTSGICTFMGCGQTSLFSKKQTALAISTTEAEYVNAEKACQQAIWMKQALIDYDILIMCDNKGTIDLSKNLVQHSRTKHIKIRPHFLRDNVQKGNILSK
nr:ribonuclease H-like domain-containing protein [Tanacetum cinerariifolium]